MPETLKTNRKSTSPILWVGGCALALFGGLVAYVKGTGATDVPVNEQRVATKNEPTTRKQQQPETENGKVKVLTPSYSGEKLELKGKEIDPIPNENQIVTAVNGYLDSAKITPKGARLASAKMDGDLVILNFSSEFETTYGSEDEKTLVQGIVASVKQFKGANMVLFQVDGHELETLGHIDLTAPLTIP